MAAVVIGIPERRRARMQAVGEEAEERIELVLRIPGNDGVAGDPGGGGRKPDRSDDGRCNDKARAQAPCPAARRYGPPDPLRHFPARPLRVLFTLILLMFVGRFAEKPSAGQGRRSVTPGRGYRAGTVAEARGRDVKTGQPVVAQPFTTTSEMRTLEQSSSDSPRPAAAAMRADCSARRILATNRTRRRNACGNAITLLSLSCAFAAEAFAAMIPSSNSAACQQRRTGSFSRTLEF